MWLWDLRSTWLTFSGMATFSSKYVEKGSSLSTGDAGGEMELYWFVWTPFSWGESSIKTTEQKSKLISYEQKTIQSCNSKTSFHQLLHKFSCLFSFFFKFNLIFVALNIILIGYGSLSLTSSTAENWGCGIITTTMCSGPWSDLIMVPEIYWHLTRELEVDRGKKKEHSLPHKILYTKIKIISREKNP